MVVGRNNGVFIQEIAWAFVRATKERSYKWGGSYDVVPL